MAADSIAKNKLTEKTQSDAVHKTLTERFELLEGKIEALIIKLKHLDQRCKVLENCQKGVLKKAN